MASALQTIDFAIPEQEIKVSRAVLGEGACSSVFRATWKGAPVAVKCVRAESLPGGLPSDHVTKSTSHLEMLRKELLTMCGLRHPNIVRLFGVYAPATLHVGLVMELMETSLHGRTTEGPALSAPCVVHVLHDLTSAIVYLHSRNIIHRDVSPRNTLLSGDTAQRRVVAKLSDFATAKAVETIGFDRYSATSGQIGTFAYLPSEAIDKDPVSDKLVYSSAVDVYSVGAVGLFAALKKVPGGTPVAKPRFLQSLGSDHVLHSVLQECLDHDPRLRPTSADLQIRLQSLQESETCRGSCCESSATFSKGHHNHSRALDSSLIEVVLQRNDSGYGFVLSAGGSESNHALVYVHHVVEGSPAAINGRLQAGDKIIEINNVDATEMTVEDAAQFIKSAGDTVRLLVQKALL